LNTNDLIGASGVFILLVTYYFTLVGKLPSNNKWYPALNAIGAAVAGVASYLIGYWPFVILEATWTIISVIGWINLIRSSK